jgi:hypothetical protein
MDVARLIAPRQRKIMKKTMGTSGLEPLLTFDNETDNNTNHSPATPNRIIPRNRRAGCLATDTPSTTDKTTNSIKLSPNPKIRFCGKVIAEPKELIRITKEKR